MRRRIPVLAALLLAAGASAQAALAQESRRNASGLTSFPAGRVTTSRPIQYGRETTVDEVSISVVPYNWQGFYLGFNAGGAWGHSQSDNAAPFGGYDAGMPISLTVNSSGFTGGGQFGAMWQSGNWVFGPEFDVGYLGLDKTVTIGDDRASARFNWYTTFTGRIGFAWDHWLWYLKGGGAVAEIRNTAADLDGAPLATDPTDVSRLTKTYVGWAIGAGMEYGIAEHWSLKAEYLYMDFGSTSSTNLDGDTFRHSNAVHTVKAGVNYRFGGVPLYIKF